VSSDSRIVRLAPSTARIALGSIAVLAVFLTGGTPALSSSARESGGGTRVALLAPISRHAPATPGAVSDAFPLRVANPLFYADQKAAADRRYRLWRQRHGIAPTLSLTAAPLTSVSNGLDDPGITDAADPLLGGTPSDSTGAIGPNDYVEFINSEIAIYSNTNLAAPTSTLDANTFVGDVAPGADTCDPQIQWDQVSQRWLYAALNCNAALGAQAFYFGWSKSADPGPLNTNWCRYQASTGSSLEDYPKLGHDDSQIIVGTNAFTDDGAGNFTASHIFVFDKPANGVMTCPTGDTERSTMLEATAAAPDFTPVPANVADGSANGYVVSARSYSDQAHIDLYSIGRNGAGANAVLGATAVSVPAFDVPASVPQPGGTNDVLDSLDTRLTQAVAFTDPTTGKEGIWTQHTVDGVGPSVVRWYELTPGATVPTRSGTVGGPGGAFAFNGAITPTENGSSAVLTYNSGSDSQLADWRAQDPLASAVDDIPLAAGGFADHDFSCPSFHSGAPAPPPCRWGDYAGASPDPTNPCLGWGTTMLTVTAPDVRGTPQWGTQNAAIDTSTGACEITAGVVKTGSGSGTVTSGTGEIDCGPTCTHQYDTGTPVTLTATPAPGSFFSGWSGACSGTGECDLTMDKAKAVIATFTAVPETLTVSRAGAGSGSVTSNPTGLNCGASCSSVFSYGTSVALTATPAAGSGFTGWSGDCSGTGTCIVSMTQARSVTATFSFLPVTLTVSKSGTGSGTVNSNPLGISCGSICSRNFLYGTSVALVAAPASGSIFSGWSGACSGSGSCQVAMSQARSVTVEFTRLMCVVPKLRGKRLASARRALSKARCKPGTITRKYSKVVRRGRVISQRPKPGKHLPEGATVNLAVSKGKKPPG
jgi:PASTA domain/Divergent InlB B-repeat domain